MIYIHKKINCTINVRGETKKERKEQIKHKHTHGKKIEKINRHIQISELHTLP